MNAIHARSQLRYWPTSGRVLKLHPSTGSRGFQGQGSLTPGTFETHGTSTQTAGKDRHAGREVQTLGARPVGGNVTGGSGDAERQPGGERWTASSGVGP